MELATRTLFYFLLSIFLNRKAVVCETDSVCFYISVISNILWAPIFLLFLHKSQWSHA